MQMMSTRLWSIERAADDPRSCETVWKHQFLTSHNTYYEWRGLVQITVFDVNSFHKKLQMTMIQIVVNALANGLVECYGKVSY